MASLFVIQGRDQGVRYELDTQGGAVYLGRDAGNRVQLHDTEVSRRHAEVRRAGRKVCAVDLGSSNGTFVNNERVEQKELASGDQVQLGRTVMLFTGPGDSGPQNIGERVHIVSTATSAASSRIVHSLPQQEGSELLTPAIDAAENPWLARARSNLQIMYRTALAVSHTLDIDQLLSRIMQLIFEWVEADRGCIMLDRSGNRSSSMPKVRRDRQRHARRRADDHQPDDSRLRDAAQRRRAHQRRPRGRPLGRRRPASCSMGVREAICVPMQGRYDVVGVIYIDTLTPHRVIANAPPRVQRRASEADDRHRPSGGAGGRRHDVLLGDGAGRTAGGRRARRSPRSRTTSRTFCKASAAAAT